MCGIIGIYKKNGIDEKAIEKFTNMLDRCESRGRDATGVVNSDMRCIKACVPSGVFIRTPKYDVWKTQALGKKFLIGHCRQSTRGSPSVLSNDHPLPIKNGDDVAYLVHNGMISCKKWDYDPTITDTYAFVNAIEHAMATRTAGDKFSASVKKGFEDAYDNASYDSSVIVAADKDEIVICKSSGKPMVFQVVEEGFVVFASEARILRPIANFTDTTGIAGWKFEDVSDHAIITIDVETGAVTRNLLNTLPRPTPTRYIVRYGKNKNDVRSESTWTPVPLSDIDARSNRKVVSSSVPYARNARGREAILDEYDTYRKNQVKRTKKRGNRNGRNKGRQIETFDDDEEDYEPSENDLGKKPQDPASTLFQGDVCTECFSSVYDAELADMADRIGASADGYERICYCNYLGYEVPVNYAKQCPEFLPKRKLAERQKWAGI